MRGCVYLLGVINVGDKVSRCFSSRSGTGTKPILIHAKRGKENLVFKIPAKTEHGMQSASVHFQGIPGFPRGRSLFENLRGA